VDVVRIAGAAWMNLRDGWGSQSASTITQQLARQTLLTRAKTLRRNLREVVLAALRRVEFLQTLDKDTLTLKTATRTDRFKQLRVDGQAATTRPFEAALTTIARFR
jgi:hypothetical protein